MNNNWIQAIVKEKLLVTDYVANGSFSSLKENVMYLDSEDYAVLIRLADFNRGWNNDYVYVDENSYRFLKKSAIKSGDIIISNVGANAGTVFKAPDLGKPMTLGPNSILCRPLDNDIENDYIFYFFKSSYGQSLISGIISGSAQPKFNKTDFRSLFLNLPPLPEQKAIAHILGTLDDKIELNRQMNQTLEAMAQALFKSWFVDFDPVMDNLLAAGNPIPDELEAMAEKRRVIANREARSGKQSHHLSSKRLIDTNPSLAAKFPSSFVFNEVLGKWVPEGWEANKIKEFGNVVCGKTPSKSNPEYYGGEIPFVKIPNMHNEVYVLKTDEYLSEDGSDSQSKKLLPEGSISVSCIATVGKVIITTRPCHTNQQINSIVPDDSISRHFLYFNMLNLNKHFHDLASAGSTTLNLNTSTFSNISILNPKEEVLKIFDRLVMRKFSKILLNQKESQTLIQLRDRLLPELISGRVRVPMEIKNNF